MLSIFTVAPRIQKLVKLALRCGQVLNASFCMRWKARMSDMAHAFEKRERYFSQAGSPEKLQPGLLLKWAV